MRAYLVMPVAALACSMTLATGLASAQNPYWRSGYSLPRNQPVVSPWLSLGATNNAALNYFNLVRPQQAFGNQINQLQTSVMANQQAIAGLGMQAASPLGPTGHAVQFMSFRQYFNTLGGGTAGGGPMSGARSTGNAGALSLGVGAQPRSTRIR